MTVSPRIVQLTSPPPVYQTTPCELPNHLHPADEDLQHLVAVTAHLAPVHVTITHCLSMSITAYCSVLVRMD